MLCKKCGKEIEDGTAFCSECGAKAVKKMSKGKIVLIILFAVLIITVISCAVGGESSSVSPFGQYSEEDVVKTLAISTVRNQYSVSHDQDVYDIEILDTDGCYNYIVSATTESKQGFETWWFLLIKFDMNSDKYQTYIHWHGEDDLNGEIDEDRFTKNNIPEYYRTNNKFGWGKENHIE